METLFFWGIGNGMTQQFFTDKLYGGARIAFRCIEVNSGRLINFELAWFNRAIVSILKIIFQKNSDPHQGRRIYLEKNV